MNERKAHGQLAFGAVILAAGRSRRMGQPKLLLPWGESSILGHLVAQWTKLEVEQIAVVYAKGDALLHQELDRLHIPGRIENPKPERGMFSSIQCAAGWAGWKERLTHWALILGDQPHLRHETLAAVLELAAKVPENVVQPSHTGRRCHPVLLPKPIFLQLAHAATGNLREFLADYEVALAECDDVGLELDLDQPEDYKQALGLAATRSA